MVLQLPENCITLVTEALIPVHREAGIKEKKEHKCWDENKHSIFNKL